MNMKGAKLPRGQTPKRQAYMKRYAETHPRPDRNDYLARYRDTHKNEARAYRESAKDRLKERSKKYYADNKEVILAKVKARSTEKRDQILAYQAEYYRANSDKVKSRVSSYKKANPDKRAHLENRRRARKFANGGSHTLEERLAKFETLGDVCFYCGLSKKLTVDHDLPLSRGGTDEISNVLPACRSCNSKKNAKTSNEFLFPFRTNHQAIGGVGFKPQSQYTGR